VYLCCVNLKGRKENIPNRPLYGSISITIISLMDDLIISCYCMVMVANIYFGLVRFNEKK